MRKFFAGALLSLAILFNVTAVSAANEIGSVIKGTQLESGIIKAAYRSDTNKRLKIMVEKDNKRIYYNLRNDGIAESFPLQFGNGQYRISIMENIGGNKYKYLMTEDFKLDISDQNDIYLASIQNINWNENMAAVKKAKELTKGANDDREKVKAIYEYLVSNVKYDYDKLTHLPADYVPDIDATLKSQKGICYDYASTFAAMLRSTGIPAKLVKGYSKDVKGYHAWNEVYNSETDGWEIIDITYDAQKKAAKVKYSMIKEGNAYNKVNEY